MNRNLQQLPGGRSLVGEGEWSKEGDESLDLFSRIRHNQLANSRDRSDHQNVSITQERAVMGCLVKSRMDDLLSADVGKHDYDWLLTPPGTPLFSFSEATDNPTISTVTPTSRSNARSVSTGKASRLSVSQSENANSARPARSSSTARPAISSTYSSSTYFSNNNRTAVLNTSTASVTSKPSTPSNRSTTASTARTTPRTPTQSASSRSSTPVKTRSSLPSTTDKPRPSQNSRPATPTVRPQGPSIASNTSSSAAANRSNSRPSTPTRRATTPSSAPAITRSTSVGRVPATKNQKTSSATRPSSPAPRARPQAQSLAPPDFPLEAPSNLRMKAPERAISAGRQQPGTALTVRANSNSETTAPVSAVRRQSSSPTITRGRLQENSSNSRMNSKANEVRATENKKTLASEPVVRRPTKPASLTENTGFGRSISKNSMDMALKHMDIRQSMGGIRGAALFPQSIRSASQKGQPGRSPELASPTSDKQVPHIYDNGVSVEVVSDNISNGLISRGCNGVALGNGDLAVRSSNEPIMARVSKLDIYESSHYDAILLKDDSKNMNWLP